MLRLIGFLWGLVDLLLGREECPARKVDPNPVAFNRARTMSPDFFKNSEVTVKPVVDEVIGLNIPEWTEAQWDEFEADHNPSVAEPFWKRWWRFFRSLICFWQ